MGYHGLYDFELCVASVRSTGESGRFETLNMKHDCRMKHCSYANSRLVGGKQLVKHRPPLAQPKWA